MKINRVNIGELIRARVDELGLSKAKFAECLNIARQNIEKTVFQKHSLDSDLLCNICEVLDYNFFAYYVGGNECNKNDYIKPKEIKANITIEVEGIKREKIVRFTFGDQDIRIVED